MSFLDAAGRYEQQVAQRSYQLAEELFGEIMDVKFSARRENIQQVIQLEFSLEKE